MLAQRSWCCSYPSWCATRRRMTVIIIEWVVERNTNGRVGIIKRCPFGLSSPPFFFPLKCEYYSTCLVHYSKYAVTGGWGEREKGALLVNWSETC